MTNSAALPSKHVSGILGAAGGYRDGNFVLADEYRRFFGIPTLLKAPLLTDVEHPSIGLYGIPFDGGNSRTPGSSFGPRGLRNISFRVGGWNEELRVNPYDAHSMADCGDVVLSPFSIADAHASIEAAVGKITERGMLPIGVGGDHSVTTPILRALASRHGQLSLIQFDAHCDVSDTQFGESYHYGSIFRRGIEDGLIDPLRLIQVGPRKHFHNGEVEFLKANRIEMISSTDLKKMGSDVREQLQARFERLKGTKIYVTFDIDFVDHSYVPGIGSPEPFGPTSWEAVEALRALLAVREDIIGFDLVEVAPHHDVKDMTTYLAAQFLFEMVSIIPPTRR